MIDACWQEWLCQGMKDHRHQNRTESCTAMSRRPPHQNSSLETHAAAASKSLFGCLLCRKVIQSVPWEQVAFICIVEEPKRSQCDDKNKGRKYFPFPFLWNTCFIFLNKTGFGSVLFTEVCPKVCLVPVPFWVRAGEAVFTRNFTSVLAKFHFQSWVIGMLCLTFYPWFYLYRSPLVSLFFFSIWSTCCQQNLQNSISPSRNEALWRCICWESNQCCWLFF